MFVKPKVIENTPRWLKAMGKTESSIMNRKWKFRNISLTHTYKSDKYKVSWPSWKSPLFQTQVITANKSGQTTNPISLRFHQASCLWPLPLPLLLPRAQVNLVNNNGYCNNELWLAKWNLIGDICKRTWIDEYKHVVFFHGNSIFLSIV